MGGVLGELLLAREPLLQPARAAVQGLADRAHLRHPVARQVEVEAAAAEQLGGHRELAERRGQQTATSGSRPPPRRSRPAAGAARSSARSSPTRSSIDARPTGERQRPRPRPGSPRRREVLAVVALGDVVALDRDPRAADLLELDPLVGLDEVGEHRLASTGSPSSRCACTSGRDDRRTLLARGPPPAAAGASGVQERASRTREQQRHREGDERDRQPVTHETTVSRSGGRALEAESHATNGYDLSVTPTLSSF